MDFEGLCLAEAQINAEAIPQTRLARMDATDCWRIDS